MITVTVGQTYILKNGSKAIFDSIDSMNEFAYGRLTVGANTFLCYMNLKTGFVFDLYSHLFCSEYIPSLPVGLVETEKTCDCGGYITYKSWQPECHSPYCKVNTEARHGYCTISGCG